MSHLEETIFDCQISEINVSDEENNGVSSHESEEQMDNNHGTKEKNNAMLFSSGVMISDLPENSIWIQQPFKAPAINIGNFVSRDPVTALRRPIDYFMQYLNDDLLKTLALNTNLYATQKNLTSFKPTNEHEIQTLIAIQLLIGCLKFPKLKMYWEENFNVPLIANSMSQKRFLELQDNLHMVNNLDIPENNQDKFYKVSPLFNLIKRKCNEMPKEKNLCIGMQMIPFKPNLRTGYNYFPTYSYSEGIKMFVLASESGIVYDFILYQENCAELDQNIINQFGLEASVVLQLVRTVKNNAHFLYFDQFYSSLSLLEHLYSLGIYAVGKVIPSRFDNPPLLSDEQILKMGRGITFEIRSQVKNGCSVGLVQWYDKKIEIFGSNFITSGTTDLVQRYDEKMKENISLERPEIVKLYNESIAGVGHSDQFISFYRPYIKSKKWALKLITHAFDLVVSNAWIEYKRDAEELLVPNDNILDLLRFRLQLVEELVRFDEIDHFPEINNLKNGAPCKNSRCPRQRRTNVYCKKCGVYLCLASGRNCFMQYHVR